MNTCFLMGHQDAPSGIQASLDATVDFLVSECGINRFLVGYHGNFDSMAISSIQHLIKKYPQIQIVGLLLEPYFPGDRKIMIPEYFTDFYYPEGMELIPKRFCIEASNRKALDMSDWFVTYVTRQGGNSAKILRRAKRMEKQGVLTIINLGANNRPIK